ncbi:MAG: guanine deaminase [Litoreibacter sp.]
MARLLLGQTLHFSGDPFSQPWQEVAHHNTHGAVLIENGLIKAVGDADDFRTNDVEVIDHGTKLITAGFVDAHVHYPQTAMIASWGKRLIDWLNTYTFPEEAKFRDPAYAAEISRMFFDLSLSHGVTTQASFGTVHPNSVDSFFKEAQSRGLRTLTGKTCMDRNAPDDLRDTAQTAYDDSKALLEKWHGVDRLGYVITPRFTPTSTREQLEALGALWSEHPECLMQTHLSEQTEEIAWVRDLVPEARDYLDTYARTGLLGARGLYGHAIHLEPRERDVLRDTGAALAHCPTSNTFIGSGLFDMMRTRRDGISVGLATDVGGGSSFSILRTMAAAYEVGQLSGSAIHPAQLMWWATAGSAKALHLQDQIGNLSAGMEADLIVLDLASTPEIDQRQARAQDIWEAVFPTIMMGDDRAIAQVYVSGNRVDLRK